LKAEPATTTASKPGTTKGPISPQPKKKKREEKIPKLQPNTVHKPQPKIHSENSFFTTPLPIKTTATTKQNVPSPLRLPNEEKER
jgi:hypothetical protein